MYNAQRLMQKMKRTSRIFTQSHHAVINSTTFHTKVERHRDEGSARIGKKIKKNY